MQQRCFIHDIVTVDVLVDNLINDDDYNYNTSVLRAQNRKCVYRVDGMEMGVT